MEIHKVEGHVGIYLYPHSFPFIHQIEPLDSLSNNNNHPKRKQPSRRCPYTHNIMLIVACQELYLHLIRGICTTSPCFRTFYADLMLPFP
ncbi:hypothetical protein EYC84_000924 [Monilinia fructicola]|uniref:Uncharacterized protein n=1 Tax=Monilinia fructicola TaxID=38448 RepID=A0A5M9JJ01_MONFR|nr:hypothetical protein EYC84_000924 [Monilinia fructicola]